jgi:mannan endo-1,4-beta-mannosidase
VEIIPESGTWFQLVQNGTTTINDGPNGLQKLDTVIQMAEQQGLYVIMSLTNNWNPVPNTTSTGTATPDVLASVTFPRNTLSNDYGKPTLHLMFNQTLDKSTFLQAVWIYMSASSDYRTTTISTRTTIS